VRGINKNVLKVREKVTRGQPGMRQKHRELFLFPGAFKTSDNLWKGENLS
jgi:hypothetical protein